MRYLKVFIIAGVFLVWGVYVISEIVRGDSIPPYVWIVPGATAALLSDQIAAIRVGKTEVDMRKEDDEK